MRRIVLTCFVVFSALASFAQNDTATVRPKATVNLPRSNDHLLLQVGYTMWQGQPDSIQTGGLPRTFNAYFLFDFPFKTNPHWSVAIGAGVASDNIFFEKTYVGIKDLTRTLNFEDRSDTTHFKKYKLATTYLEAPIELRFSSRPDDNKRSFKVAIGAKIGTLLDAHVKGKTLRNAAGTTINAYKEKEFSKNFFNKTRIALTGRIGMGNFSLFGSYAASPLIKEGMGPVLRPLTVGLTLSGL